MPARLPGSSRQLASARLRSSAAATPTGPMTRTTGAPRGAHPQRRKAWRPEKPTKRRRLVAMPLPPLPPIIAIRATKQSRLDRGAGGRGITDSRNRGSAVRQHPPGSAPTGRRGPDDGRPRAHLLGTHGKASSSKRVQRPRHACPSAGRRWPPHGGAPSWVHRGTEEWSGSIAATP